jgi:hypothetical protein
MKAVILAGGLGTRISEETAVRPKPMVEIGGKPHSLSLKQQLTPPFPSRGLMPTEFSRFDDARSMGEPASRPLSGWRNRLAALFRIAMPRHDSSSCFASRLLHPVHGRVHLLFRYIR